MCVCMYIRVWGERERERERETERQRDTERYREGERERERERDRERARKREAVTLIGEPQVSHSEAKAKPQ